MTIYGAVYPSGVIILPLDFKTLNEASKNIDWFEMSLKRKQENIEVGIL